jgi:hypothetical protein
MSILLSIPRDLLRSIFYFLNIKDSLNCCLTCSTFNFLLLDNKEHWKRVCQDHWDKQKDDFHTHKSSLYYDGFHRKDQVTLDSVQKILGFSWFNFAKLFAAHPNIHFVPYRSFSDVICGVSSVELGKNYSNYHQFWITDGRVYIHNGNGGTRVVYSSGLQYIYTGGDWFNSTGQFKYKDGTICIIEQKVVKFNERFSPGCDPRHPLVIERFNRKECCGIGLEMPQYIVSDDLTGDSYCEHCWTNCQERSESDLIWEFVNTKCCCKLCHKKRKSHEIN